MKDIYVERHFVVLVPGQGRTLVTEAIAQGKTIQFIGSHGEPLRLTSTEPDVAGNLVLIFERVLTGDHAERIREFRQATSDVQWDHGDLTIDGIKVPS